MNLLWTLEVIPLSWKTVICPLCIKKGRLVVPKTTVPSPFSQTSSNFSNESSMHEYVLWLDL